MYIGCAKLFPWNTKMVTWIKLVLDYTGQFTDTSRFFSSSARFSSGVFLLQLNLLRMLSCSFFSLLLISLASLKNWVGQPTISVDVDREKKTQPGNVSFYSFGSQSKTYQAVCRIFLQVNVDTLGDLEQPAPLSLQGVHVGLPKSIGHTEWPAACKRWLSRRRKIVSLESYRKLGGCCSTVHPLWFWACSAPSLSPPSPSSEPFRWARAKRRQQTLAFHPHIEDSTWCKWKK